jgi:hypothetical protein
MTDKKTYPEFVKLILALQDAELYEQAKICVKALYILNRKDKRIAELEAHLFSANNAERRHSKMYPIG